MSYEANTDAAIAPAVPERTLRPSEDNQRMSDDVEGKRPGRGSMQSTARAFVPASSNPDGLSYERSHQLSPSYQQITHWQPPQSGPVAVSAQAVPSGHPALYSQPNSNDYTLYDEAATTGFHQDATRPRPSNGIYFHPIYRGLGVEGNEPPSGMASRQTSMATRPVRRAAARSTQPRWPDAYEQASDDYDEERTPQKKIHQRKRTNVYVVREGGGSSDGGSPPPGEMMRLPFTSFMHGTVKNHFVAVLGEFVGTTMFLFFAFAGTIVANVGARESSSNTTTNATVGFSPIVNLYVAVSFGFSLMVNVWIFFRVSGGLFNPSVTLGMVMTKTISYARGILLVGAQIGGAIFASFLVQVLFPLDFNVRTTLAASTSVARGVFIEAILTAELVFTVFMLAKEKHKATYMAPIGIGMALFVAELVGVFFTGGSLNPARSLGPCVTTGEFDSDHWVYWVGPALGAIAAFIFYRFIKILEYEMANPGQDNSDEDEEAINQGSKETRGQV